MDEWGHDLLPRPHPALTRLLPFLAQRVAGMTRSATEPELDEFGLDLPALLILVAIAAIDGLSQEAVSNRTGIDRSTVSIVVRELEEEGYVECGRDPFDRRRIRSTATRTGIALSEEAAGAACRAARRSMARLDRREYERLRVLLTRAVGGAA